MACNSSTYTKSANVPFKFLAQPYPVLRNFLNIMPLHDLSILRDQNETVKSLSEFRGDFVKDLNVQTDTYKDYQWYNYTLYSKVTAQRFNTTPLERLGVHMGHDICPEALLAKMDGQLYRDLYLHGEYSWKDVITFLHEGVEFVSLHGNMELPAGDMKEFFETLMRFKVKKVSLFNTNCQQSWLSTAFEIMHKHVDTTMKSVELLESYFSRVVAVATDDTVMEVATVDFGGEYDVPMDDEVFDVEMVDNNIEV